VALRKGKWVFQSVTGGEADMIRAEFEMGRDLAAKVAEEIGVDPDPPMARLLNEIGGRLAARLTNRQRRFTFQAVSAPEPNAFALPGGFIFVTGPLLDLCDRDPDEIAFVLGHEMGHVVRGHAVDRLLNDTLINVASRRLQTRGWAGEVFKRVGSDLLHGAYSRDQELEVDRFGFRLTQSASFNPYAALRMLERLKGRTDAGGDAPLMQYFASHPPLDVRIESLRRLLR
jgi:predicted Zn-dependent protease